mmetsp:Transcript_5212/g.12662  ORF Transcript_5212/g.12662 Transcript_5212/m.12662 type:complete len:89 (-) Transcript_5212:264-530(-)
MCVLFLYDCQIDLCPTKITCNKDSQGSIFLSMENLNLKAHCISVDVITISLRSRPPHTNMDPPLLPPVFQKHQAWKSLDMRRSSPGEW